MNYIIMCAIIIVLWAMIFLLSARPLISVFGKDNPYSKKAIENGNNTLSCLIGVALIFVAYEFWAFLKWVILVFYGLAFLWSFLISFLFPLISGLFLHDTNRADMHCMLGSFLQSLADLTIVFFCMRMCFGWL